uniref:T-box domain-containing protein n=1 Tax=Caenorhabditis tropicalis TaxID=1561998 RepID=A0A1I7TMI8_9PELO
MSDQVHVCLREEQDKLWRVFHSHKNEMIVTKSGRKMFPKLEYVVRGLSPNKLYAMMLHIEQADDSRYKFSSGEWMKSGKAEQHKEPKKMWHADGVRSGKEWMATPICFDRVKITNSVDSTNASMIFLHSMHKYNPVLSIYESPSESPLCIPQPSTRLVTSVRLTYTEFIAVTAYQNDNVIKLKIEYNPFAKGFREGSQGDRKRNSPSADESTTDESASSPQPKKQRNESISPPMIPRVSPSIIPHPNFHPFLYTLPYLSQFAAGGLPPTPFPFPLGFPCFTPLQYPVSSNVKIEQKEQDQEEIEPEINVV